MISEAIAVNRLKVVFRNGEERHRHQAGKMWTAAVGYVQYQYSDRPEGEVINLLRVMAGSYSHLPRGLVREEIQTRLETARKHIEEYEKEGLKPSHQYLTDLTRTADLLQKAGVLGEERTA